MKAAREGECVGRFEGYLRRRGLLDDALAERVRQAALELLREGIAAAEAEPPGDVSLLFQHAYAEPPPPVARDLDALRAVLGL